MAAKLTGWRIDIKSVTEAVSDALNNLDKPELSDLKVQSAPLIEDVQRIIDKKNANKTVMPEEYNTLARFADIVERRLLAQRDAARQARVDEINAVKATLPQRAFTLPITSLDLPDSIIEVLQPLENVGEIMWRFLIDEDRLRYLLKDLPEDSLMRVQAALDKIVIPEGEEEPAAEVSVAEEEVAPIAAAPEIATEEAEEDVVPAGAFGDEDLPVEVPKPVKPAPVWKEKQPAAVAAAEDDEEEDLLDNRPSGKKKSEKKKERLQRRQLIFDEEIGQVIAKRRRKGGRGGDEWDDE